MKVKTLLLATVVAVSGWGFVQRNATAFAETRTKPGLEPYTPTRMEWLILDLQANGRHEMTALDAYGLNFVSPDNETVVIFVRYSPKVSREAMNIGVDTARRLVESTAKGYGWQSWVKTREDIKMVQPKR